MSQIAIEGVSPEVISSDRFTEQCESTKQFQCMRNCSQWWRVAGDNHSHVSSLALPLVLRHGCALPDEGPVLSRPVRGRSPENKRTSMERHSHSSQQSA